MFLSDMKHVGCMDLINSISIAFRDIMNSCFQGTASAKEFYKRHHKWTEGLLSAAKSVGWGASILV